MWGILASGLPPRRRMTRLTMFGLPLLLAGAVFAGIFKFRDEDRPRVVLDPGHAADEYGAAYNDLVERDSNLDMARRVGALLTRAGVEVVYTRTDDERAVRDRGTLSGYSATFADLEARIAIANRAKADLFVSIHSNGFWEPGPHGLEVFYNLDRPFADWNRELAESIRQGIVETLESHRYETPPSMIVRDTEVADAAGHTTPFLVLGPARTLTREEMEERGGDWEALGYGTQDSIQTLATEMPGVLVELFYISNPDDAALLKDDSARHYMAQGIAAGILRVLGMRDQ